MPPPVKSSSFYALSTMEFRFPWLDGCWRVLRLRVKRAKQDKECNYANWAGSV